MAEYAKYLRAHPEIRPCVVSITREPGIETMAAAYQLQIRRSKRLIKMQMNGSNIQKPIVIKKSSRTPKSILVSHGNSRLRGRSKSVSFDPQLLSPRTRNLSHVSNAVTSTSSLLPVHHTSVDTAVANNSASDAHTSNSNGMNSQLC